VDAEVGVGMSLGPLGDFREPRAGDKNTGGSDPVIFEGLLGSGVYGVHHTEIVGVNDEEAGVVGITETLRQCVDRPGRCLLSEDGREGKDRQSEDRSRTKHGAASWRRLCMRRSQMAEVMEIKEVEERSGAVER